MVETDNQGKDTHVPVSRITRLLARRVVPVAVLSSTASASSGGNTSVEPNVYIDMCEMEK